MDGWPMSLLSLFLGPFVSAVHIHVSRREGDWPMHDIGLEEIAFFFSPRPWWSKDGGCKSCLCLTPAHVGVRVFIVGGQCETLRMMGVWYRVGGTYGKFTPSWSWTRCC